MASLEARGWVSLQARLAAEMPQLLHPVMADAYREKVMSLCQALEQGDSRAGAAEAIRELIEMIVLEPERDKLKVTPKGDLAGMLSAETA